MATAKYFYKSECDENEKSLFVESNGWVNNFMHHNGFSLHRKTTTAQQDPERQIDNLFCIFWMLVVFQLNLNTLLQVQ